MKTKDSLVELKEMRNILDPNTDIEVKADINDETWILEFCRIITDQSILESCKEVKGFVPGSYEIYLRREGSETSRVVGASHYESGGANFFLEKAKAVLIKEFSSENYDCR